MSALTPIRSQSHLVITEINLLHLETFVDLNPSRPPKEEERFCPISPDQ